MVEDAVIVHEIAVGTQARAQVITVDDDAFRIRGYYARRLARKQRIIAHLYLTL